MSPIENYISVMADGLEKKIRLLEMISEKNAIQRTILESDKLDLDEFDKTVEDKGQLVDELVALDSGFEVVYNRVKTELADNKGLYTEPIKQLQKLIAQVTELSVKVQTEEAHNKELVASRFGKLRDSIKETKKNSKAVTNYYKNMTRYDSSPQFLDRKK